MAKILIIRKGKGPKLSATKVKNALDIIDGRTRIQRTETVSFMLNGGFAKLPEVKQSEIDSDMQRRNIIGKGWEIPEAEYGHKKEATVSVKESIRAYLKTQLKDQGLDPEAFSVILVD